MDVEDALRKLLHEPGGEKPHIASQADEIDLVLLKRADYFSIVNLAVLPF